MTSTMAPPQPAQPAGSAPATSSSSSPSYSLFPPIPAPLQRLFDLVPLVTYPANALPGDDGCDDDDGAAGGCAGGHDELPTLYVFVDPADAARGRASFNPTCLKWQTFLRFAGVPVHLAASSNHASPTGALPFLQPPRRRRQQQQAKQTPPSRTTTAKAAAASVVPPPRPIPAHDFPAYAEAAAAAERTGASSSSSSPPAADALRSRHPRAPAYQALLDTSLRRAWLHAVYLDEGGGGGGGRGETESIAARLYAHAASASPLVRAALAHQLRAAAAAEVWGGAGSGRQPTAAATAQLYRDAEAALSALSTLLGEGGGDCCYFFGSSEPTLFDAAVFAYTHLLLEDDDDDGDEKGEGRPRFRWRNRVLPDMVRAHPRLVQHRAHIVARYWQGQPTAAAGAASAAAAAAAPTRTGAPGVADSVSWVKV